MALSKIKDTSHYLEPRMPRRTSPISQNIGSRKHHNSGTTLKMASAQPVTMALSLPVRPKKTFEQLMINPYLEQTPAEDPSEAGEINTDSSIPARVICNRPIRIAQSKIVGAGRGTFAVHDIKAGQLIYSIKQATIAVVSSISSLKYVLANSEIGAPRTCPLHL